MFNPTLLFHKTTVVCSFRTPSTFLHTWLIRPPLTIVPRGVSLQVLRCGKLCWLSACVSHVLSNLLLLLRRLPCTLLSLTSPFVLAARELSRYTCTCSMPIILWTWLCLVSYSYVLQTSSSLWKALLAVCLCVPRFIKFTLVASKATMYVAEFDVTFCFSSMRIVSFYMYM